MIVTTTPSLEGQTIESYLGPISAHVVFGVNIFSDIAASWRDVFGGRSQTYQKQLHRLTAAALQDLEQSAKKLRANAIVGLKMDYAEISGGGKAGMFMVVATGTAVLLSKSDQDPSVFLEKTVVSGERINMLIERSFFMEQFDEPNYRLSSDALNRAIELRAHDTFASFQVRYTNSETVPRDKDVLAYLEMCVEEKGYRWLLNTSLQSPSRLSKYLHQLLQDHDDFRLVDLEPYLNGQKEADPVALIEACTLRQNLYLMQDKTQIEGLAALVRSRFVEVIKMSQKRTLLGNTKDVYFCSCGSEFLLHTNQCTNCSKNKWGLPYESTPPDAAIANLTAIAHALASISA
jgi:uncharacterized protein YbjQ (UPF0145 family)